MASSVQERLQMIRTPLDKWTTREQLCLASAVSCSGENWMTVSRALKLVCGGGNGNGQSSRPADWFSQKNCAVQYGNLLENVETPKRKRTSESGVSSPAATVETPTDLILRRLSEQRIQELKAEIRQQQDEFAKIHKELKALKMESMSEGEILEMWQGIEKEHEEQRLEEERYQIQMRDREQQRQEMQRNWRSMGLGTSTAITHNSNSDMSVVDMDVEEIIGVGGVKPSTTNNSGDVETNLDVHAQTRTSPLLSSLLKSPTSTGGSVTASLPSSSPSTSTALTSARVTAPTITTLLTSGSIPNASQPAITLKSSIPANEAAQLLTRPISGPPVESQTSTPSTPQTLLSPSQAAPTLSMLLEKNKLTSTTNTGQSVLSSTSEIKGNEIIEFSSNTNNADDNADEVPMAMGIGDDIAQTTVNTDVDATHADADSDEPDDNEEQQLLEVFKNIGNIEDLDIDVAAVINEEDDFLKGVDEDSPHDGADVMDFENKSELDIDSTLHQTQTKPMVKAADDETESSKNVCAKDDGKLKNENEVKTDLKVKDEKIEPKSESKVETISSDDSNDNIPLAAVVSLEHKERTQNAVHVQEKEESNFLKEKVESAIKNEESSNKICHESTTSDNNDNTATVATTDDKREIIVNTGAEIQSEKGELVEEDEETKSSNVIDKSPGSESESSDVIIIPTDDDDSIIDKKPHKIEHVQEINEKGHDVEKNKKDSNEGEVINGTTKAQPPTDENIDEIAPEETKSVNANECEKMGSIPAPPTISIADTDEDDSSTTDVSIITRKEDKASTSSSSNKHLGPQQRKSIHEGGRHELKPNIDESFAPSTGSSSPSATPARPPMLRKLRDRDRSESPMIDFETSTTNTTASEHSTSQRLRRRYSSTPVTDSVPNSPASSDRDDTETKVSKKSLLSIFNALQHNKHAVELQRALNEVSTTKYEEICLRPIDLHVIRKSIESGSIRSFGELQRDILLMCQNGVMIFKVDSVHYKSAQAFAQECQSIREFVNNSNINIGEHHAKTELKENKHTLNTSAVKVRSGSRKSQRIT